MDKIELHGNVMWLQNLNKYDHSKEGFDIINDPYINRTLHIINNCKNDLTEFVWVLPNCDEREEKFLRYMNENYLNGVIAFKFVDKKYYGTTEHSNITTFMEEFSMLYFDSIYDDSDIVVSEFPINFGEHVLYLFQGYNIETCEDSGESKSIMTSIINTYGDAFVCVDCPLGIYTKELFDNISEYFLGNFKIDAQASALRDMLETNKNYKVLLWDYPIELDRGLLRLAIEDKGFISQFDMVLYTNTSNASESMILESLEVLLKGADLKETTVMVVLDGSDDVDKDVLRAFLSHYGEQVGVYSDGVEISHQNALFSLISPISKINTDINNIKEYIAS